MAASPRRPRRRPDPPQYPSVIASTAQPLPSRSAKSGTQLSSRAPTDTRTACPCLNDPISRAPLDVRRAYTADALADLADLCGDSALAPRALDTAQSRVFADLGTPAGCRRAVAYLDRPSPPECPAPTFTSRAMIDAALGRISPTATPSRTPGPIAALHLTDEDVAPHRADRAVQQPRSARRTDLVCFQARRRSCRDFSMGIVRIWLWGTALSPTN